MNEDLGRADSSQNPVSQPSSPAPSSQSQESQPRSRAKIVTWAVLLCLLLAGAAVIWILNKQPRQNYQTPMVQTPAAKSQPATAVTTSPTTTTSTATGTPNIQLPPFYIVDQVPAQDASAARVPANQLPKGFPQDFPTEPGTQVISNYNKPPADRPAGYSIAVREFYTSDNLGQSRDFYMAYVKQHKDWSLFPAGPLAADFYAFSNDYSLAGLFHFALGSSKDNTKVSAVFYYK